MMMYLSFQVTKGGTYLSPDSSDAKEARAWSVSIFISMKLGHYLELQYYEVLLALSAIPEHDYPNADRL